MAAGGDGPVRPAWAPWRRGLAPSLSSHASTRDCSERAAFAPGRHQGGEQDATAEGNWVVLPPPRPPSHAPRAHSLSLCAHAWWRVRACRRCTSTSSRSTAATLCRRCRKRASSRARSRRTTSSGCGEQTCRWVRVGWWLGCGGACVAPCLGQGCRITSWVREAAAWAARRGWGGLRTPGPAGEDRWACIARVRRRYAAVVSARTRQAVHHDRPPAPPPALEMFLARPHTHAS